MRSGRLMIWTGGFAVGLCGLLWVLSYLYPSPTRTFPMWSDRAHHWLASNYGRVSFARIRDRYFSTGYGPPVCISFPSGLPKSFWHYQLPEYWDEDVVTFIGGIDKGFHTTGIAIPYWIPTIVSAVPLFLGIRRMQSFNTRNGLCRYCGYDLRASPLRCPECGTPVPSCGQQSCGAETISA